MWFYLAALSALFNALANIARRTHGSLAEPAELSWWSMLLGLPLNIGFLMIDPQPIHVSRAFVVPAVLASVIGVYGGVHQFKAYKYGEASVVSPLTNLLPIVMLVSSFLIVGTIPSWGGVAGVFLVVGGVYFSSVSGKHDLLLPFRRIVMNKGSRAMLVWVLSMAVSTTLVSVALKHASVAFLMLFMTVLQLSMLSLYLLFRPVKRRMKRGERVIRRWGWHLAAIAVFGFITVLFQMQAMKLIDATYVLAVKRLDVLFTVLLAGLFLKEKHTLTRFKGSIVALIGVVIIVLTA